MPRTLPWLIHKGNASPVKQQSRPRKRAKRECTPVDDDDNDNATSRGPPKTPEKRDFFRSSQTPPSSPARQCPPQEFLLEGLDHDDAWIMVEDEFYAIALSFTQHLHYAEYIRRKKEARSRGTQGLNNLQRPTDGRTALPKESERKKEAESLHARQQAGLADIKPLEEDLDDDDDTTWAGTHLHGLMTSPRKSRSLMGVYGVKSATRAAAGYKQAGGSGGRAAGGDLPRERVSKQRAATDKMADLDGETASDTDDLNGDTDPGEETEGGEDDDDLEELAPAQYERSTVSTSKSIVRPDRQEMDNAVQVQRVAPAVQTSSRFRSRVQSLFDDLDGLPEPSQCVKVEKNTKVSSDPEIQPFRNLQTTRHN
ncbi:hypothetical protein N7539_003670 [Penicillium diatomitis]|uniref:Uncharacterized protein n=1 Tax=Penicillium diatomitis TaxID=2819901 RepID=A0A9W9XCD9_9EURO|nr:uncharacterized protein N7539_003670 [Penicillium diatomitis]KAJ5488780.1 hypothetical protein N7539_003670 [Penicillium diatomitis]